MIILMSFYNEIKNLINNDKLRKELAINLSNENIDTRNEFKKIEKYCL